VGVTVGHVAEQGLYFSCCLQDECDWPKDGRNDEDDGAQWLLLEPLSARDHCGWIQREM
jgi:hypothetical protein